MLAVTGALCIALACRNQPIEPTLPRVEPVAPGVVLLDLVRGVDGVPNGEVNLSLELHTSDSAALGAVQARLKWDPERLEWLGIAGDAPAAWPATRTFVNEGNAAAGELRLAALNVAGLEERFADLAFRALAPGWESDVSLEVELVLDAAGGVREAVTGGLATDPGLAAPISWHVPTTPRPSTGEDGGPRRVPGASDKFGDGTLDNAVDSLDVSYTSNVSVGNLECIVGTDAPARDCLAINVSPFNSPGLGGPTDACPPGLDTCGGFARKVNVVDALFIAIEVAGTNQPVIGEQVPSQVVADTVYVSGVITGTRTFLSDSVYVLSSDLVVGDTASTGTLVVPAGTEIRGAAGSALIVSRLGRILAEGTPQSPIRMVCHDASPEAGCWEGLIVAGNAVINQGDVGLGAAPTTSRNSGGGGEQRTVAGVRYGGDVAADSSGVLKYVVVEDAGESGAGIVLAAVGSATVIDGLQSHHSGGVGIEVVGGTVDLKHLVVTAPATDGIVYSLGHEGRTQYAAVQMDPDADPAAAVRVTSPSSETPVTAPEVWNATVVGGTAFYRKHTAVAFEGAGGIVRNALWVQTGVGIEADAGACTLFGTDDLDVDHVVMLGTTETASASCASGLVEHLEGGEGDGLGDSRFYQGDLEDPFDGELWDIRAPGGTLDSDATPATPGGGLDASGEYFGAVDNVSGVDGLVPWTTGWAATGARESGIATLPEPTGFNIPTDTLFLVLEGDSLPRRQLMLLISTSANEVQVADLFETFGLQIVGAAAGYHIVRFPDPGSQLASFTARRDSIAEHPAVESVGTLGGSLRTFGRYPIDSNTRSDWDPGSFSLLQAFKNIRAPQAWSCEAGLGAQVAPIAVVESRFEEHDDLPTARVREMIPVDISGDGPGPDGARAHALAVVGIIGAEANDTAGIAGLNWGADVTSVSVGETNAHARTIVAIDSVTNRGGIRILGLSTSPERDPAVEAVNDALLRATRRFLAADPKNIIVAGAGQRSAFRGFQDIPSPGSEALGSTIRVLNALAAEGYRSRILIVVGSDTGIVAGADPAYVDDSFVYQNADTATTLLQISAPYLYRSLDVSNGTDLWSGTSFGMPLVAAAASLLYQAGSDLATELMGSEVIQLLLGGAKLDEAYLPQSTELAPLVSSLPGGSPPIYQLDAYGSIQLLSLEKAGAPICGLDVFASGDSVVIMRTTPESFATTDTLEGTPRRVEVAPGGRTLAVMGIEGVRYYQVDGAPTSALLDYHRVQFLEKDTAFFSADSVRIGSTGSWVHLAGDSITILSGGAGRFHTSVSPEGTTVIYPTSATFEDGDSVMVQLRRITGLKASPSAATLTEVRAPGVGYIQFPIESSVSWTDFGDRVLTSRFEFSEDGSGVPTQTEFQRFDPASSTPVTLTSLTTVVAREAFGQVLAGGQFFRALVVSGSTCTLETRSMTNGSLVTSRNVTADVPDCVNIDPEKYYPGLAPPRALAASRSGGDSR